MGVLTDLAGMGALGEAAKGAGAGRGGDDGGGAPTTGVQVPSGRSKPAWDDSSTPPVGGPKRDPIASYATQRGSSSYTDDSGVSALGRIAKRAFGKDRS